MKNLFAITSFSLLAGFSTATAAQTCESEKTDDFPIVTIPADIKELQATGYIIVDGKVAESTSHYRCPLSATMDVSVISNSLEKVVAAIDDKKKGVIFLDSSVTGGDLSCAYVSVNAAQFNTDDLGGGKTSFQSTVSSENEKVLSANKGCWILDIN